MRTGNVGEIDSNQDVSFGSLHGSLSNVADGERVVEDTGFSNVFVTSATGSARRQLTDWFPTVRLRYPLSELGVKTLEAHPEQSQTTHSFTSDDDVDV